MQRARSVATRGHRILVAVSPGGVTSNLLRELRAHGFDSVVIHDGSRVLHTLRFAPVDAIVVDVGLVGLDLAAILTGLAELDAHAETPLIALTPPEQRDRTVAELRGIRDDYLVTPIRADDLVTRLRLRARSRRPPGNTPLRRGDLTVDVELGLVSVAGRLITLTPTEFALLRILISNLDRPLSREDLAAMVWREPPSSNVVDVYIGYLRRKLGHDRIRTVRGVGYLLED